MPYSFQKNVSDGVTTRFQISFPYSSTSTIRAALVTGAPITLTVDSANNEAVLDSVPLAGVEFYIFRKTSLDYLYSRFQRGSMLTQELLFNAFVSLLHIQQEYTDGLFADTDWTISKDLDMRGNKVVNLGQPIQPTDAARLKDILGFQGVVGEKGDRGPQGPQGPQGEQGLKGDSFLPDAVGHLEGKSAYDQSPKDFIYLATDQWSGTLTGKTTDTFNFQAGVSTYHVDLLTVLDKQYIKVLIGGVPQNPNTYSFIGNMITFTYEVTQVMQGLPVTVRFVTSAQTTGAIYYKLSDNVGDWSEPIYLLEKEV